MQRKAESRIRALRSNAHKKRKVAIVAPYPPPGARHVFGSGVASYTRNLAEALSRITQQTLELHVITEYNTRLPKLYVDKGIVIHRVYTRSLFYPFQIFRELCKINPDITHIQHEYFLYGGVISALLFPLLTMLARLVSNKVIVTLHGVIPLRLLDDSKFKKENGIKGATILLKLGLLLVTKLIILFSKKIIVHERFLKGYLEKDYKGASYKIVVIPHGVEDLKPIPRNLAKRRLSLEHKKVLLYFGYLTGYKGLDNLIEIYENIAKRVRDTALIIAGGIHPRLAREKWYVTWLYSIIKKAYEVHRRVRSYGGQIIFTGYVPEESIRLYFSAADVVLLPYKARIAASGAEALALAFERCCILSNLEQASSREVNSQLSFLINSIVNKCICEKYSIQRKRTRLWRNIAKLHLNKVYFKFNRKVKFIVMITPEYPPHNIGGGGVVVQNLVKNLSSKGYKVLVLSGYYKSRNIFEKPWYEERDGIHIIWLPLVPTPSWLPYLNTVMPPNIYSSILLYKIIRKISKLQNCAVHLHGYGHLLIDYAAYILRTLRKPYILTIHGIPKSPFYAGNKVLKLAFLTYARLIGKKTLDCATKITTVSKSIAKETLIYGIKPDYLTVIPNGIDCNYVIGVKKGIFREKYDIHRTSRIILCIGRLHPRKGFQYIISALPHILEKNPNVKLVIIGDGPYRDVLEKLVRQLRLEGNVLFTGYVDNETKKEALVDSDIVVIPSLIEPFGLVALEAMVAGKPIVAFNVGGLKEVIGYSELLVPPAKINALASKVIDLLNDNEFYAMTVTKLQRRVQSFFWSNLIQKYIEVYNKALQNEA